MKLQTKYHGEIEVEDNSFIQFETGIPGFLEEKKFIILQLKDMGAFSILQSVETPDLGFLIANPFLFFPDYEFELIDSTKEQLQIENRDEVEVYSILTLKEPFEDTTANLQAPIVINNNRHLGKQVVLAHKEYHTKHLIAQKSLKVGQEG
ncbi:flagellar assembly protein FliW [Bacillus sp. AK128]